MCRHERRQQLHLQAGQHSADQGSADRAACRRDGCVVTLTVTKIANGVERDICEPVSNAALDSGNTFCYGPTHGQYVYNLSIKGVSFSVSTFRLNLYIGSDTTIRVLLSQVEISLESP